MGSAADSPAVAAVPHHRRSVTFDVIEADDDQVTVIGRLRDERPWARTGHDLPVVHDLELALTVTAADLVVRAVDVQFRTYPHAECPQIAQAYQRLVGLSIGRGWAAAMRDQVGGPAGCTHLRELARAMAPALLQSVFSRRQRLGLHASATAEDADSALLLAFLTGSCHIWAADGVGEQKLRRGWRPGTTDYPVPALADLPAPSLPPA